MSDNILDKLRQKRQRSSVPERDDHLINSSSSSTNNQLLEQNTTINQSLELDNQDHFKSEHSPTDATLEELKAELAKYPPTRRRSAIVLEEQIEQELTRFCKERRITVEVFLEAAWQITNSEPTILNKIVSEAQKRYSSRKQAGKLRRLITMLSSSKRT